MVVDATGTEFGHNLGRHVARLGAKRAGWRGGQRAAAGMADG